MQADGSGVGPAATGVGPESGLVTDGARLGLERRVVDTPIGPVVVRCGRRTGDTATILLHGAAGSWTTWTPLITYADRRGLPLTDLVIPDLPGWGESLDPEGETVGIDDVADALAQLTVALGYRTWRITGHSLGGFLALAIAARTPDATASVVLVSPTGPAVAEAVRRPLRGGLRLPWFAGMLLAMRALAAIGSVGVVRALRAVGLLRLLSSPLFADRALVHASVVDAFADELRPAAFVRAARAAAGYDASVFSRVRCPVESVRGQNDVFSAASDTSWFARTMPSFREIRVPDAGHFAAIEAPGVVLQAIIRVTVEGDGPTR
jgi:pimeloyl-ACP methyl ester carboxylesterase